MNKYFKYGGLALIALAIVGGGFAAYTQDAAHVGSQQLVDLAGEACKAETDPEAKDACMGNIVVTECMLNSHDNQICGVILYRMATGQ